MGFGGTTLQIYNVFGTKNNFDEKTCFFVCDTSKKVLQLCGICQKKALSAELKQVFVGLMLHKPFCDDAIFRVEHYDVNS